MYLCVFKAFITCFPLYCSMYLRVFKAFILAFFTYISHTTVVHHLLTCFPGISFTFLHIPRILFWPLAAFYGTNFRPVSVAQSLKQPRDHNIVNLFPKS